jgi:hypothetical protein
VTGLSTLLGALWRSVSWMPGFFFRRRFSKKWLAEHTTIDLRSRHEPLRVHGGELPELEVWIVVMNRSYFPVELDRLTVEFTYGAAIVRAGMLQRHAVEAGKTIEIMIRQTLTAGQIAHIVKAKQNPSYCALQIRAELNCKVHDFSVDTGQLQGVTPSFLNC